MRQLDVVCSLLARNVNTNIKKSMKTTRELGNQPLNINIAYFNIVSLYFICSRCRIIETYFSAFLRFSAYIQKHQLLQIDFTAKIVNSERLLVLYYKNWIFIIKKKNVDIPIFHVPVSTVAATCSYFGFLWIFLSKICPGIKEIVTLSATHANRKWIKPALRLQM